ncbi:MAG: Flavin-dependent oxidoreductase, F420-dependent methylene-tetrahydromethanopterin reductase [Nitrospira sp.]|nr:MAG: Flavin-dependent oxidoreductase, F420-dependent methylene-tetrahydromethanopterin reductase [Nitrospira sp.]
MKFGLSGCGAGFESLAPAQWPVFAQMAEAAGFDSIWLNEEHFQRPQDGRGRFCLSPLIAAAQLVGQTQRIRIGFSVLLLPLHNPIRLAEEIATLDVMSAGRINVGISRGGNRDYSKAFGVDPDVGREGFERDLSTMMQCWSPGEVSLNGGLYDVQPKPLQQPTPPVYIGTYNEGTASWAAHKRHRLIQHGIQSLSNVCRIVGAFEKEGGNVRQVPIGRFIYVGTSDDAARQELLPVLQLLTERLRTAGIPARPGTLTEPELEVERFYREMVIAGGPDTCRARLLELSHLTGSRHVNCLMGFFGYLPPDLLRRSLRLFSDDVMPYFSQDGDSDG